MLKPNDFSFPQELLLVGAAIETGIIPYLHEHPGSKAPNIANALTLNERAASILLEALTGCGYADSTPAGYQLSVEFSTLLYPDSGGEDRFSFLHTYYQIKRWADLAEVIRSGKPMSHDQTSSSLTGFMHAMRRNSSLNVDLIATLVCNGLTSPFSVLDIGGGPLVHARAFSRLGATVTILDTADTLYMMERDLVPGEPLYLIPGDFNIQLPDGPFDIAYLGNICHIYGPEQNRSLFRRVYQAVRPGGRIAIHDFVRDLSPRAPLFSVNMLVSTENGGTWSQEEYFSWLEDAQFSDIVLHNLGDHQLMIGKRP
ncbi:MAG: O-methyltransferase family 2 [Firmicutes bacterium]|nr:O-methyltransferase family 2 [Bacillota bacterium]